MNPKVELTTLFILFEEKEWHFQMVMLEGMTLSYLVADRKPANFYEYEANANFNHRHIIDIPRIKIFEQRSNRGNWRFSFGHYLDKPFKELLPLTENFLDKVDNWAQVDSTVCDYKNIKKEKEDVLSVVKIWLHSEKEFFVRAGLVILLAHYVEKRNLEEIYALSRSVEHNGYYVYMANVWLISVCMAKYLGETIDFLKNNTMDKKTHNKAIQKSRESFRVSKENKEIINELKK